MSFKINLIDFAEGAALDLLPLSGSMGTPCAKMPWADHNRARPEEFPGKINAWGFPRKRSAVKEPIIVSNLKLQEATRSGAGAGPMENGSGTLF